jgi:hypothetical protein
VEPALASLETKVTLNAGDAKNKPTRDKTPHEHERSASNAALKHENSTSNVIV